MGKCIYYQKKRDIQVIKKQLKKRYIRLSKLFQMILVFFIRKKDRKKCIVQNYRYLNKWTIKNNYPLSLISNIVENIRLKKYLLSWTYDRITIVIKKENEW